MPNIDEIFGNVRQGQPLSQDGPILYSDFKDFIKSINPPREIKVGEEIVDTNTPFVVLRRNKSVAKEIFTQPYFSITRKVRLTFHWDGIQILGANMESPNCFILPVPSNKDEANWFFKTSCSPTCTPGVKPLYVSVETLRENLILRGVSIVAKIFASVSLCAMAILPFLYFTSDSVQIYIERAILGESITGNISIASLALFSIIIFSKRFDEVFTALRQDNTSLGLVSRGGKLISRGINVKKRRT